VVKELKTSNSRDVAPCSGSPSSHCRARRSSRGRQILSSSLSAPTRRFGIYHDPAAAADVAARDHARGGSRRDAEMPAGRLQDQMPAADMQRLHSEIDWSVPTRRTR
jgi:hypothetical protein